MCHLYPYNNVKLLRKFFYINICGFIGKGKFLYETHILENSYLQFKFQLPTSDSTQITAGSSDRGFCTRRRPLAEKIHVYLTRVPYYI